MQITDSLPHVRPHKHAQQWPTENWGAIFEMKKALKKSQRDLATERNQNRQFKWQ
jgi:hypothetical protein